MESAISDSFPVPRLFCSVFRFRPSHFSFNDLSIESRQFLGGDILHIRGKVCNDSLLLFILEQFLLGFILLSPCSISLRKTIASFASSIVFQACIDVGLASVFAIRAAKAGLVDS